MRSMSGALLAAVALPQTNFCYCWKVTRRDLEVFAFTSNTRDITFNGVTYAAQSGFTPFAIEQSADLTVDNSELQGVLISDLITQEDIFAGLWEGATVQVFMVDHQTYSGSPSESIPISTYTIGNINSVGQNFVAEVRGLTQHYLQNLGGITQPKCRAVLGDSRCGVDLGSLTINVVVASVTDRRQFTVTVGSPQQAQGYYDGGLVVFTSGENDGFSKEIATGTGTGTVLITLKEPMFYDVAVADTLRLKPGCLKRLIEDCQTKFNNVVNFRGEPYVPGPSRIFGR